jgi:hypothetical protein
MASAPPWNTTEDDDASRFTTTAMATAAYTPVKSRTRATPRGVEQLRPSTSPAKQPAPKRATVVSVPSVTATGGASFPRWGATSSQRAQRVQEQQWQQQQQNHKKTHQQHQQLLQHQPDLRLASTLGATRSVASGSGRTLAVAQQQVRDAYSIHASTAGDGGGPPQRPKRYFSNYVDAAKGHTYKVSEVDRHVLTNRNLEGSPTAPAPPAFRQFLRDPGAHRRVEGCAGCCWNCFTPARGGMRQFRA